MTRASRTHGYVIGWAAAAMLAVSGASGCTAEKTEPGKAPDVDVDVDVDPGRWPEYKINWADVDVGTREQTVTVPVVEVRKETRQVQVPYIDINPPGARDREQRTIQVEVDVPHAGYRLQITEVRASGDDLWVIAQLTQTAGEGAQALTRASDQVVVNAPVDLDVRKLIVGERPPGNYNEQHRFAASMSALNQTIPQGSRVIYQRAAGQS